MPAPTGRQRSSRALTVAFAVFVGAWAVMAWYLSLHVFVTANSDAANVMLVGWDVFHGNVLLHGWELTADPFWTSDALVFGALASILGLSDTVLRIGVVAIAVAVVALAVRMATIDARHRLLAAAPVIVVLCFAAPTFRSLFLAPVIHIMTTGYCLAAFHLLRRPSPTRAATAALVLALAVIGDAAAYPIGIAPIAVVALVGLFRSQLRRAAAWRLGAAASGAVVAVGVLHLTRALGGFQPAPALPTAPPALWAHNLFRWGPQLARLDVGAPRLALCAAGVAACLWLFLAGAFRRSPSDQWAAGVLAASAFGGVGLFVYVALPNLGDPEARYLTPTVIFSAVAAGVALGRVTLPQVAHRAATAAAAVGLAVAAIWPVQVTTEPVAANPYLPVIDWLRAHHLVHGMAPYWNASSLAVASGNRVQPRAVMTVHGRLEHRRYNARLDWFDPLPEFLVWQDQFTTAHGQELDPASAVAAFGPPSETVTVGGFHVMVWTHSHRLPVHLG